MFLHHKYKRSALFATLYLITIYILTGCAGTFKHPLKTMPARFGEFSRVHHKEISELPPPREKVYAAVYSFRDQTGQYKLTEHSSSWSTVVTQGATSILIQSLEESNWFITIEREGLSNLLNERRIIRQTQEQFQGSGNLPPLLYAGVIIEGGIIAYETNIRTGGVGARYFGTGASGQYREDQVTVYLRAVSTSTGRILKTVHASKTILSQKMDMGVFRFVSLKKLLEAETGYTYNEPSFVAVQEAIDKAVLALIVEGIEDNLWELQNPDHINMSVFESYRQEKEMSYATDHLGNLSMQNDKMFSVGLNMGGLILDSDVASGVVKPGSELSLGFFKNKPINFSLNIGSGKVAAKRNFNTNVSWSSLTLNLPIFPQYRNSPFLKAGYGINYQHGEKWFYNDPSFNNNIFQFIHFGAGYQWKLQELPLLIRVSADCHYFLSDEFDGMVHGKYNDRIWGFSLGIAYRFNLFKND
ncbi:curli production assembly/transport component CsgG [Alkalitalea saponilacus]|uniref:Curli production assembly/transport component CsgG n=2 Tax=Alkalitalea saponilacus TaxID=889453 RepID=A0A1T5CBT3_9BACT|nr:CsgG/HfaB family protein [Alkalitalea saponilacus]ASB49802.1 curli production assembly/transport component CsgG [Alkalitalea saponilacus]SKB56917.1 curli production assembly/transport component CsgG [Alkalitalea saponilacus]